MRPMDALYEICEKGKQKKSNNINSWRLYNKLPRILKNSNGRPTHRKNAGEQRNLHKRGNIYVTWNWKCLSQHTTQQVWIQKAETLTTPWTRDQKVQTTREGNRRWFFYLGARKGMYGILQAVLMAQQLIEKIEQSWIQAEFVNTRVLCTNDYQYVSHWLWKTFR